MTVIHDEGIKTYVDDGLIGIEPFDERNVQPASYDLTLLADKPVTLRPINHYTGRAINEVIDTFIELLATMMSPNVDLKDPDTFADVADKLEDIRKNNAPHGSFQLLSTREIITLPPGIQGEVHGRSSLARKGLFVHVSAGFCDPGFSGQITLECINVSKDPIQLLPGDRVAQIVFTNLVEDANVPYNGRYQNQRGPTESRFAHGYN